MRDYASLPSFGLELTRRLMLLLFLPYTNEEQDSFPLHWKCNLWSNTNLIQSFIIVR